MLLSTFLPFYFFTFLPLTYTIQLLDNREDEESCKQTDNHQGTPYYWQWHIPHMSRNRNQLITKSGSHKPATHNHTLILRRSYLRYKRYTDR